MISFLSAVRQALLLIIIPPKIKYTPLTCLTLYEVYPFFITPSYGLACLAFLFCLYNVIDIIMIHYPYERRREYHGTA